MADPPPTGVRAEDICRLCENIIDLLPVHPTMLYEIGLTTIWKHVGHHLVFKDGDENVATSMSQFLKFPMSGGVLEHEDERVLAAQRKARATKDKAVGKRSAAEESEPDDSTRSGSGTHHSPSSLTTIIPNDTKATASGSNLSLESANC
ncbi:hypothetical protein Tco_0494838 [Tanacetum coccineum]